MSTGTRVGFVVALVATALLTGTAQGGHALSMRTACGAVLCGDRLPAWSPDGRAIAFIRYVRGRGRHPRQTIAAVPARGDSARTIVGLEALAPRVVDGPYGPFRGIRWSPDSKLLAFDGWWGGTWIVRAAGGKPRFVAASAPSWSPDSRSLAYETRTSVGFRSQYVPAGIGTFGVDGSGGRLLAGSNGFVVGGRWAANPHWSARDEIAFVTGDRLAGSSQPNAATAEIWSIRPDGSGAHRLAAAGNGYPNLLAWSSDGERLFFLSQRADSRSLEVVLRDGSSRSTLLVGDFPCCWLSPDGTRVAGLRSRADEGLELHVIDIADGTERRLATVARHRNADVSVAWSRTGDRLAFVADGECHGLPGVHTVTVLGSDVRRLTGRCRRNGTARADVMRGSAGPDALYGRGGADRIYGGAGLDFLQGGTGDDYVRGGLGDDRVYGGPGRDHLYGDGGSDTLHPRDGAMDVVRCGTGRDNVRADRQDAVARDCERVERE